MSRIEPDPWLTEFVGVPAHRVVIDGAVEEISDEVRGALAVPSFAWVKVDADDVATVGALEELGFRVVDVNVALARPIADGPRPAPCARFATDADEHRVAVLAASQMRSRFHLDPAFPPGAADRLKEAWARSYWHGGRGDWMVVAEVGGVVAGFLQLLLDGSRLVVDLIAVAPDARRTGVARSMLAFAEASCGPAETFAVGTQVGNVASLRLYESAGFRVSSTSYVLHAHGPR